MRDARALRPEGGQSHVRSRDAAIASLAAGQHGVVARVQLLELGLGRAIDHRVECGRLHGVHRGLYAVGHTVLTREGGWMASVLAAGRCAVLSHRSAAALWRVRIAYTGAIEVTVPRALRSRSALRVHRTALTADEVTMVDGIPVTTPPRTLFDLAAVVRSQQLERAVDEAEVLRTRTAFERDRARDRRLQAAGWRVVRVTWRHLHDDPVALVHELRGLLGTRVPC